MLCLCGIIVLISFISLRLNRYSFVKSVTPPNKAKQVLPDKLSKDDIKDLLNGKYGAVSFKR